TKPFNQFLIHPIVSRAKSKLKIGSLKFLNIFVALRCLRLAVISVSFQFRGKSMLRAGIVGLPNVGKSTLFNALTAQSAALAANYPFATIEPNVGVVSVPDERLEPLARIVKTEKIVPATVEFLDIAGLVRGASKGEGLGNQFLANIRETDTVVQVV